MDRPVSHKSGSSWQRLGEFGLSRIVEADQAIEDGVWLDPPIVANATRGIANSGIIDTIGTGDGEEC